MVGISKIKLPCGRSVEKMPDTPDHYVLYEMVCGYCDHESTCGPLYDRRVGEG